MLNIIHFPIHFTNFVLCTAILKSGHGLELDWLRKRSIQTFPSPSLPSFLNFFPSCTYLPLSCVVLAWLRWLGLAWLDWVEGREEP